MYECVFMVATPVFLNYGTYKYLILTDILKIRHFEVLTRKPSRVYFYVIKTL